MINNIMIFNGDNLTRCFKNNKDRMKFLIKISKRIKNEIDNNEK